MAIRAALESRPAHSPVHNKLSLDDQAVHRWYRFVLSFPPHLVQEYLERFGANESHTVLDPFCGTGTTLVECKKRGIAAVGIEANPMPALAVSAKIDWTVPPAQLLEAANRAATTYHNLLQRDGFVDENPPRIVRERTSLFGLRTLDEAQEKLLLKGSISSLPLHRSLTLLQAILDERSPYERHLVVALAWSLVNEVGNIRFGPEVGISPPKTDADVLGSWFRQVERMAEDLEVVSANADIPTRLVQSDSREAGSVLHPRSVDFVITSPPYPNEKDYTRTTRLESVVLGLIKTSAQLREIKRGLVRSNTRGVYVDDEDHFEVRSFASVQTIAEQIEARRLELGKTSGFERLYHKVARLYFGGMRRHLRSLAPALNPGARLAYVVGDQASYLQIMIRTGQILAEIAESCGYEVESIDLFRTRLATATKEQLREEVVVLRYKGAAS